MTSGPNWSAVEGDLRGPAGAAELAKLGCATGPGKPGFGPISEERGPALEKDGPRQQQAFGLKRRRKRIPFFSNYFPKQILKARIQIIFKLEFKSNHSKNLYAAA